jgi:hypothetical protein
MLPSSVQNSVPMEAACFSSASVMIHQNMFWHIPEKSNHQSYRRENFDSLKSHVLLLLVPQFRLEI